MSTQETWAQLQARLQTRLGPVNSETDIRTVTGQTSSSSFSQEDVLKVLDRLGVGFFFAPGREEYQLVQTGEDIPACDRVVAFRSTRENRNAENAVWLRDQESTVETFCYGFILQDLRDEVFNTAGATDPFLRWHTSKFLGSALRWTPTWHRVYDLTAQLKSQGFLPEDIHDLFHHYDRWSARNPEFVGVPQTLVYRAHGLAPLVESGLLS